jgi:hypothetical protein
MMKMLTKIEQLDQRFPGLADKVRLWFDRGVPMREVSKLLFQQYTVSVPRATLGNFRARRWVREREARTRAEVKRRAALEILRELEMKDSPQAPTASLQAKAHLLFYPDIGGYLKSVLARSIRTTPGSRGLRNGRRARFTGVC